MKRLGARVRDAIAKGKLSAAVATLGENIAEADLRDELVVLQASAEQLERDARRGLLEKNEIDSKRQKLSYAILSLLSAFEQIADPLPLTSEVTSPESGAARTSGRTIFISYNHEDRAVATSVKERLVARGIKVRIDMESIAPGEDIRNFIERSIRETDVTLSIVSTKSLLSTWVAMETVNTFFSEKFSGGKKFIACFVDDGFLQNGFRLEATAKIDAKLLEIDELIPRYAAQKIDTNDLNDERSRLFELRNHVGDILKRLRGSLSLDLRGDHFEKSVQRVADEVSSSPGDDIP
jgi:hypothetical protein